MSVRWLGENSREEEAMFDASEFYRLTQDQPPWPLMMRAAPW
jgi:hypothetical protein